jgi:hypothetical protein
VSGKLFCDGNAARQINAPCKVLVRDGARFSQARLSTGNQNTFETVACSCVAQGLLFPYYGKINT